MPIIQYLATHPSLSALLALTIIGFTVCYGVALPLGRIGVEVGFVLNAPPRTRRLLALAVGSLAGFCVGAGAGAAVGSKYGLGPDHVFLGLLSFLGLTAGTFVGGIGRASLLSPVPGTPPETSPYDSAARDRAQWIVWHYTNLELGQAIAIAIAVVLGMAWGVGIELAYPVYRSGAMRFAYLLFGAGAGGFLGGTGVVLANPHGRVLTIVTGTLIGLASAGVLGVFLVGLGRQNGSYLVPGLIYGGLGGACFGMIGGDPVHAQAPQ